jgi:cysteine desulfurase
MPPIYLDNAATTPMRPEVRAAMEPFLAEHFGNPSSGHRWGREARAALEEARERVAAPLGATPEEILFVRGGTESDNLAILGAAVAARRRGGEAFVVGSAVEHPAVGEAMSAVADHGGRFQLFGVGPDGTVSWDELDALLARRPTLLSVMWVNNEVGLVLPVEEIARRAAEAGVPVHSDAVQAVGKVPVRVDRTPVALMSVTGHKLHGPKGSGLLFVRQGTEIAPQLVGGGQERGMRPGTEDVAGAVGLAAAVSLAVEEQEETASRLTGYRNMLQERLEAGIPGLHVAVRNGPRAPHILFVTLPGVEQPVLLNRLDEEGLAVSGGSACHSGEEAHSTTLTALYPGSPPSGASIRYSFGEQTREEEVVAAAELTIGVVAGLG